MAITLNGTTGITTPDIDTDGLSVDTNAIFVDPATKNVGIGLSGALNSSKLTVLGETAINTTSLLSSTGTLALSSPADGTLNQCGIYMRAFDAANQPAGGAIFTEAISASSFRANLVSTYMADSGGGAYIIRQFIPNSASTVERLRIDASGNLLVGTTIAEGSAKCAIASTSSSGAIACRNSTGSGSTLISFINSTNTAFIGSISNSGDTATLYNTTSDYRLKENVRPLAGALDRVMQLEPCQWDWIADGSEGVGFIAHKVQAIRPQAVSGTKDAVDKDGKPQYQGMDASFLIADLTAALQELKAELDTVKAELNTLKGN